MGKIISGFSNIGKSTLSNNKKYKIIDFDTHYFRKEGNWVEMYIECMLALQEKYDFVFITTYGDVLQVLNERGIEYTLIYPKMELKEEYRQRAIARGSDDEFVNGFFSRWEKHINDCEKNKVPKRIILESNQFLSDVIDLV